MDVPRHEYLVDSNDTPGPRHGGRECTVDLRVHDMPSIYSDDLANGSSRVTPCTALKYERNRLSNLFVTGSEACAQINMFAQHPVQLGCKHM